MKKVFIVFGILLVVALIGAASFLYHVRQVFLAMPKAQPVPDALKVARVVTGAGLFSKAEFFHEPDLGVITDIEPRQNGGFIVVGHEGAAFLHSDGSFDRNVHFEPCGSDVVTATIGAGAFLCRGSWHSGAMVFDSDGKMLWSYRGGMYGVDDAAAGSLGSDHSTKVAVGLNGDGGVRLLGSDGKELWKQDDGNVWHVEIVSLGDKSGNIILHSNARGELIIRDATGKLLARHAPELYLASFSLSAWFDDPQVNKVVAVDEQTIYVLTAEGKTLARLPAPGNSGIADPKGTPAHFSPTNPYYVGLLRHDLWKRSLLYIYDAQSQLAYNEILDHDCGALRAVPSADHAEDLLLGCDGVVWKYSLVR